MRPRESPAELAALAASSAIILEALAHPKPGCVHRLADLKDLRIEHFAITAIAIYPAFLELASDAISGSPALGRAIYEATRRMLAAHGRNTSLGAIILLSPLVASAARLLARGCAEARRIVGEARGIMLHSDVEDAIFLYKAVRLVAPSYIRKGDETGGPPDVWDEDAEAKLRAARITLADVLRATAPRDIVCREIVEGYPRALAASDDIRRLRMAGVGWAESLAQAFLRLLASYEDTLVARKLSPAVARELRRRAREALEAGGVLSEHGRGLVLELDAWARRAGANPGSLADILAAGIFLYMISSEDALFSPSRAPPINPASRL